MVISSPCLTDIKNWLVQKQTAFGKDFSNPFTADSLLKTICAPCYSNEALAIPEQTATGKEISNPFMAGEDCWVLEDFTTYCCWFNIGAASEDLVLLRKIEENRLMFNQCFIIVALDLSKVTNPLQAKGSRSIQKMTEQDSPPPTITAMKIPIIKKGEYDIWSMRMRQYICHTDHNLWDIIVDGDLQEEAAPAGEQSGPPAPKTAKQLTAKRNQERVKSILLLAIPDEYLLKFHNVPDAKSLWAAIKSRFGGNDESKKMQRNVLKHQFENFTTAPNESLDKAYDRFQKLISQLEVHAAPVSKEDINQKFLRSLPPSWSQIALIMRNKPDIDQTDIDDLYNNLRVYEDEMKRSSSSTSCLGVVVQIVLWYLDSGCSKHMIGDRSLLTNFVNNFLGIVKFGNDHVEKILGYGDYQIGNVTISRVFYVEGLGHNLFSVGQLCNSNLEVAFRQHTCFIRNLDGVDLLTRSRGSNLYTLSLGDMMVSSPICLLLKASKTKSWLWHRRLSHLNFSAINHLARHGLVQGLPKLKFEKDHLCAACAMGKSKKKPYKPKSKDTNQEKLYLLHMDLCGPMRVASVNGKKYILVIVDDYCRFTCVKCLRSKDEAPDFIIKFLKMIQVRLKVPVRRIITDNGTKFVNQTLREYYEKLIYAKAPLFLWGEAVATTSYTQNRSIIRLRHGKTPYELLHDKLPDLSFFHVFGALYYLTNDSENLSKLQPKADIGIFIGYAPIKKAFRVYNRCTRRIIETIHVDFDELIVMASEHSSLEPALHEMTLVTISSGLVQNPPPSTPFVPHLRTDWDILFQPLFDEVLHPLSSVDQPTPEVIAPIAEVVASEPAASTGSPSSTTVDQDAPSPSNSQITPETQSPIISNDVEE
ncbi:retrovirus-related pol polyprotein from transposon TNT 1-94 [Tanacetum coccineum]